MIEPPRCTEQQLERQRLRSIELFRQERMQEPLEAYLDAFDEFRGQMEDLLERTGDLAELQENALAILSDELLLKTFRYLPGPPISQDDLETLAEASLSRRQLAADPLMVSRIVDTVLAGLDRRRFPWIFHGRKPNDHERSGAILASAAMIATSVAQSMRRNEGKNRQELRIEAALLALDFVKLPTPRVINTLASAPSPGHFCRETTLGTRKADFVVGLWDLRTMPIEAKVSNSSINSRKRLNNDAAVKAEVWRADFGKRSVVPTAVLSGVYDVRSLVEAQERGLTLFWAHDLSALSRWIKKTRSS
jgi:hypothetical protein